MIILLVASFLLWHGKIESDLWLVCLFISLVEIMSEVVIVLALFGVVV